MIDGGRQIIHAFHMLWIKTNPYWSNNNRLDKSEIIIKKSTIQIDCVTKNPFIIKNWFLYTFLWSSETSSGAKRYHVRKNVCLLKFCIALKMLWDCFYKYQTQKNRIEIKSYTWFQPRGASLDSRDLSKITALKIIRLSIH